MSAFFVLLGISASAQAVPPDRLFAGGAWAAHRFGARCEASARPLHPARQREPEARAGFQFDPRAGRSGEFFVRLSRDPRAGSSVMLTVGTQPFLLVVRGPWAWSRGPAQDEAIIAAARAAGGMRVEARDQSGRSFVDRYLLAGAATAIDAAAAGCSAR